jgi:carbonic anhydrase
MDNTVPQNAATQADMTPAGALAVLKEGNQRFVSDNSLERDMPAAVKATGGGQHPLAAIVGCIDSRVPAEMVFDQGIGDIFNVRIAGNFVNSDMLGSLEFACKVAGSKAIVVLGHTHCGAVKGACDHVELGNLTGMLKNIAPAVDAITDEEDRSSANPAFVQKVADKNVELTLAAIRERSSVLREMEENGEIKIVGAMYDVETGAVSFY